MKKVLVVLLIAVLAVGSVFADVTSFTGELTSTLTYDLVEESFKFDQAAKVTGKFGFGLFNGSSATGSANAEAEGYPYAIIEGALSINFEDFEFSFDNQYHTRFSIKDSFWDTLRSDGDTGNLTEGSHVNFNVYKDTDIRFSWSQTDAYKVFTTAKIVGENWDLDLLKNFGIGNFATNTVGDNALYAASYKVYKEVPFDMDNSTDDGNGATFTYDGYKVSVNRFTFKDGSNNFGLSLQSKDFDFNGITGTVAGNFQAVGDDKSANVSAKAGYEAEDIKVAAATDVKIGFDDTDSEFDVSLSADYKDSAVKFDFYYASEANAANPYTSANKFNKAVYKLASLKYTGEGTATWEVGYKNSGDEALDFDHIKDLAYSIEKLMSAKVVVDVAKLVDLGPVSALSVTVDGHDMLNKDEAFNLNAYNAEVYLASDDYGTTATFGAKNFTDSDARRFYAEVKTDVAKLVELPFNSLTVTVGSDDLSMEENLPIDFCNEIEYDLSIPVWAYSDVNCLYAKVESEINDDLTVGVTADYLAGEHNINAYGINAKFTGIENVTLGLDVKRSFKDFEVTYAKATAKYEHEIFTVDGQFELAAFEDEVGLVGAYIGASSDKIVHGATLSLAYGDLDDGHVTTNWKDEDAYGSVIAKCVISF